MLDNPQEIAARLTQEEKERLLDGSLGWWADAYGLIDYEEVFNPGTDDEFLYLYLNELGHEVLAILKNANG